MAAYLPPGWPAGVHPPGSEGFERTAVAWLLDVVPPDFRLYGVLRRHPVALATMAKHHVAACVEGARDGYRTARTELGDELPPPGVEAVLAAYRKEGKRLVATASAVDLILQALRTGTRRPGTPRAETPRAEVLRGEFRRAEAPRVKAANGTEPDSSAARARAARAGTPRAEPQAGEAPRARTANGTAPDSSAARARPAQAGTPRAATARGKAQRSEKAQRAGKAPRGEAAGTR